MHKALEHQATGVRVAVSHSLVVNGKEDSSLTPHWEPGKTSTDCSLKRCDITVVGVSQREGSRGGKTR